MRKFPEENLQFYSKIRVYGISIFLGKTSKAPGNPKTTANPEKMRESG
jgi:hypothetical protein